MSYKQAALHCLFTVDMCDCRSVLAKATFAELLADAPELDVSAESALVGPAFAGEYYDTRGYHGSISLVDGYFNLHSTSLFLVPAGLCLRRRSLPSC